MQTKILVEILFNNKHNIFIHHLFSKNAMQLLTNLMCMSEILFYDRNHTHPINLNITLIFHTHPKKKQFY